MSFTTITEQHQLETLCQTLMTRDVIAIDTEFVRQRTYNPILGLIQINCGETIYLIDPVDITDWQPMREVLLSQDIVKVIHSCSEDIEVFKTQLDVRVARFFDTQIAEGFISGNGSLGLAVLVNNYQAVELDKGHARTDWLQRPLTDKQLNYAADDVRYLLDIYHKQVSALEDRVELVYQDVDMIVRKKYQPVEPAFAWRDIKSNWQLTPRQLSVLKELVEWRLTVALERDLAVNFVVKERTIVLLSERQPTNLNSMKNIPGIHPMEIRKHGKAMLACIERGKQLPIEQCPPRIPRLSELPKYKALFADMKNEIKNIATKSGVAVELLASKRQINQFISYHWQLLPWSQDIQPELASGWRGELLNEALTVLVKRDN